MGVPASPAGATPAWLRAPPRPRTREPAAGGKWGEERGGASQRGGGRDAASLGGGVEGWTLQAPPPATQARTPLPGGAGPPFVPIHYNNIR